MKKKMIRKLFSLALMIAMTLSVQMAQAEAVQPDPYAAQRENAIAAMKVSLPDATLHYAVRERDDGRDEWNLFFTQSENLGVCKVIEKTNEIRKVELFKKGETMLTADLAMEKLAQQKGAMTILELELDWDDGYLTYEGEAEMNGKRYEFEMTADGEIIEWERD